MLYDFTCMLSLKMENKMNKRNKTETESDTNRCVQRGLWRGWEVSSG